MNKSEQADYDRFQELGFEMKKLIADDKAYCESFRALWQEREDIKNKTGGMPPEKPKDSQ